MEKMCRIVRDIARYVLKTRCGVILPLMSKLIFTVARQLNFIWVYLSYAVLSAVMYVVFIAVMSCIYFKNTKVRQSSSYGRMKV